MSNNEKKNKENNSIKIVIRNGRNIDTPVILIGAEKVFASKIVDMRCFILEIFVLPNISTIK